MYNIYPNPNIQWANQYLQELYYEEAVNASYNYRQNVNQIYIIITTQNPSLFELLERYRVPPIIIQILTRRIIQFTLDNANKVSGNINRKVDLLYRQFVDENQRLIFSLTILGVPQNVLERFIKGVIRATLEIIENKGDNIDKETERLLKLFEQRFPNYLGLTNVYKIPRPAAQRIVSNIIKYTLTNANRISPVGTILERADQMLRLLDREKPELIEAMITRGVPANQAEAITRRIIIFTLRNGQL